MRYWVYIKIAIGRGLFTFNRLTSTPRHLFGEGLFSMLANIADAGRTVGPEQKSEYLSDEIGIYPALSHILGALGTGVEAMTFDARPNLTPSRLLILMATGTPLRQILTACAAVKPARRYEFFICFYILHISKCTTFQ